MPISISPVIPAGHLSRHAQPVLRTDELILRPWLPEDAPAVLQAFTDPAIRYWHRQTKASQEEALAWIGQWPDRWQAEKDACWAVTRAADVVRRVSLCAINLFEGAAQITYWSLPAARGQGVATRGGAQVARWAFEMGFHCLELKHSVANPASCRVADKLGFPLEGTMRGALRHEDGWHDMHLHARIVDGESVPADLSN
ncbi:GNAT family N-acetyltransferase [Streptosporangium sandarakinum]|uniref:RimJ/RimL family protein N-acetyltransferase n=1 Tax=Streptosporangium sandarakinum TaxID=1260955 RepID=A0A852V4B8_9ACTN|nr:GNAT family N-acetyltransferase [Streptosporangium sandarakinum]NYF44572.1 RimJ/RimL family protein N-acetyltransferase [Streptosporangium sandarakinum]